jgi:hypothetical protein
VYHTNCITRDQRICRRACGSEKFTTENPYAGGCGRKLAGLAAIPGWNDPPVAFEHATSPAPMPCRAIGRTTANRLERAPEGFSLPRQ